MDTNRTKVNETLINVIARLERLPSTRYMWTVFLVASFGYFFDFFEVSLMGSVAPSVSRTFNVSTAAGALLITVTLLGMLVGAAFGGYLADRYGRKRMFMFTLLGWGILALITAFSVNYAMIFILRAITGIFLGIEIPTLDSYLNEILPSSMRGKYFQVVFAIFEWYVPVIFLLALLIVPLSPQAWRYMFIIGGAFALPLYIARLFIPESPRWLVVSNKLDKADETLKFMENHIERNLGRKLPEPNILNISVSEIATEKVPVSEVFRGKNLKLSVVWLPLYFLSFFGWYFFITALPSILVEAGYTIIKALYYTLPVSIAAAVFAAPPVFTIDTRIGRRGTLIYSAVLLIVSATFYILIHTPLALIIFGAINSGMVTIWADVVHQWGPETYPNRIRASATGFNYASARAGAALAPYAGVMIVHYYGLPGIFITGIVVAILSIALSFAIPETRKKILEVMHK